jgi:6-pyruvoyltetrahydropterin/6-carboxytetrahydropterin synthase
VIGAYDHHNLSELPEFADINPTSEILARSIYRQMSAKLNTDEVKVNRVKVGESENSDVVYFEN